MQGQAIITVADHYAHHHLKDKGIYTSADLLRVWEVLCKPGCDQPFCFFSTSGVHGSYSTLDDMDETWDLGPEETHGDELTVVVYLPRLVTTWRGEIKVEREDIPRLRELALQSLINIVNSQFGNLPIDHPLRQEGNAIGL